MFKSDSVLNMKVPFNPVVYFVVFLISNLLLSYFDLSLQTKLQVGLLGIVLPMVFALISNRSLNAKIPWNNEFLSPIPPLVWGLVIFSGIFLRFYRLTSLSAWPMPDEGMYTWDSLELAQKGVVHFFYTIRQHPPLFNWLFGIFLMLVPLSLFSLWLFPALVSALIPVISYGGGKAYFSKSFSFLLLVLVATSFWPLYAGK